MNKQETLEETIKGLRRAIKHLEKKGIDIKEVATAYNLLLIKLSNIR